MINVDLYSTSELINKIGDKFKKIRLLSNMTQKDVSEQSGVTITTIQNFESGKANNISFKTFLLLMRAVNASFMLNDLFSELPDNPYLSRKDKEKLRVRHSLNKML